MKKKILWLLIGILFAFSLSGCGNTKEEKTKIGVALSSGSAIRWTAERAYMEQRAKELGIEIDARLSTGREGERSQKEDCIELIDSGIDVLIMNASPRESKDRKEILSYAKKKGVKIIAYARPILEEKVDLFVGYDTYKIGQSMGKYLAEKVYKGDYILLKGDENDFNTPSLYNGAKKYIDPMLDAGVTVILDAYVPGWSAEKAKLLVKEAVAKNGNKVDAILAPNDALAGASAAALEELGITRPVVITGMDAELAAVKRIVDGKQDVTVYMDLRNLAYTAVEEAVNMAKGKKVDVNAQIDNGEGSPVDAYLINGQVITKENIDKILINSGRFTLEEIYSKQDKAS